MAKQTAVQFLVMRYNQWQGVLKDRDIEEAKSIEKEQIKDAYHKGGYMYIKNKKYSEFLEEIEEFYNDTYTDENNK
jgi:hypothetical protein